MVVKAVIHKMHVRITNKDGPDQSASSDVGRLGNEGGLTVVVGYTPLK